MKEFMNVPDVTKRLKRVEGQIRGIVGMVEEGKTCGDIIMQISSAKSALHKAGELVLQAYLHQCLHEGIVSAQEEESLNKISAIIEQFSKINV